MQTHDYSSTTQGSDFLKMSQAEQGAVDVHHPAEGDHKKKSVVGKVKDKAKKLKTKIKDATKKKRKDEHGNEVDDTSSSGGEEEGPDVHHIASPGGIGKEHGFQQTSYEPSPEVRKDGVVHGGEYKSRDMGGSGLPGLGQVQALADPSGPAPGTALTPSRNEPRAATSEAPSYNETQKRQNEVPSAFGRESAGVSSGLASAGFGSDASKGVDSQHRHSEDFKGVDSQPRVSSGLGSAGIGSDASKGVDSQPRDTDISSVATGLLGESVEKVPENIMKPTQTEQPQPIVDGVDSSGRDYVASEGATPMEGLTSSTDTDHYAGEEEALNKSGPQKGWMQRATEGVTSVKNALLGSPKSPASTPVSGPTSTPFSGSEEASMEGEKGKTWTDKARETAVSVKDTISSKLPTSTTGTNAPVTEQEHSTLNTSNNMASNTSSNTSGTMTSRALETVSGVKDTVASKLGYGKGSETIPATTGSELDTGVQKPGVTQKLLDVKDTIVSKLGIGGTGAPELGTGKVDTGDNGSKLFSPDEHDTALSQKITDMLTLKGSGETKTGV